MVTFVRQIRTKLNDRPLPYQANSSAFQCFISLCIANFFRCSSYIHTTHAPGVLLAVGFEPVTVDSRELYAPTERRMVKFGIYIHQIKACGRYEVQPFPKNYMTKLRIELVESYPQTPTWSPIHKVPGWLSS